MINNTTTKYLSRVTMTPSQLFQLIRQLQCLQPVIWLGKNQSRVIVGSQSNEKTRSEVTSPKRPNLGALWSLNYYILCFSDLHPPVDIHGFTQSTRWLSEYSKVQVSAACRSDGAVVLPAVPEQWMDADSVGSQRGPDSVTCASDAHRRPEHPAAGTVACVIPSWFRQEAGGSQKVVKFDWGWVGQFLTLGPLCQRWSRTTLNQPDSGHTGANAHFESWLLLSFLPVCLKCCNKRMNWIGPWIMMPPRLY